jgi:hypothetical protein
MYSWVNTLLEEAALSRKKQKTKYNLTQVVFNQLDFQHLGTLTLWHLGEYAPCKINYLC